MTNCSILWLFDTDCYSVAILYQCQSNHLESNGVIAKPVSIYFKLAYSFNRQWYAIIIVKCIKFYCSMDIHNTANVTLDIDVSAAFSSDLTSKSVRNTAFSQVSRKKTEVPYPMVLTTPHYLIPIASYLLSPIT